MSATAASPPASLAVAPSDDSASTAGASSRWRRLRPHLPFLVLLGLGALLRLLFLIAYRPAFWFYGDSGVYLQMAHGHLQPHPTRPLGYSVLLKMLEPTGSLIVVAALQHLISLAVAVGCYLLLLRRGVARWLCCLAAVPLLFDGLVLTMGHFVMPDALLSALTVAAVLILLWSPTTGYPVVAASGALVVAAWITKPSALPLSALLLLYLLVRRVGWRRVATYAVAFGVPCLAFVIWIGDRQSVYGSQSGTALYGRAAMIADCDRIQLTPDERIACPDQPLGQRWDRADAFFWRRPERLGTLAYTPAGAKLLTEFSMDVIRQQPLDYLRSVAKESAAHFVPGMYLGPGNQCLREREIPPVELHGRGKPADRCAPSPASANYAIPAASLEKAPKATSLTRALHSYGVYGRLIPVVLSIAVLLGLAVLVGGRRAGRRLRLDVALLLLAGPGLTVLTVMVGMYEPRYALPALPLSAVAAALAWHGLTRREPLAEGAEPGARAPGDAARPAPQPDELHDRQPDELSGQRSKERADRRPGQQSDESDTDGDDPTTR